MSKASVTTRVSEILGEALQAVLESDPREAAERAFLPGGPPVDALEERIRRYQSEMGMPMRSAA